jgi:hypothetical protein
MLEQRMQNRGIDGARFVLPYRLLLLPIGVVERLHTVFKSLVNQMFSKAIAKVLTVYLLSGVR